ncbi:MAG: hypothetical protein CMH81_00250 [Nitrospiraceae bacterium]|nr:hypothetical protein [Nitrospiraceae bacterium]|tara:strand:+ start:405 stop:890 length:486 start_codon:yes stop_codon:yes gene_type:complete
MTEIIPSLNHWVHLMSAIIWIGGAIFLAIAVTPILRKHVAPDLAGKLAAGMYKKYQRVVGVLFLIILVTGGINLHFVRIRLGGTLDQFYITILSAKLVLVMVLMTLFLYNALFWSPATPDKSSSDDEDTDPPDTRFPFQRTTVLAGILVVLMAAILKHLHL